jgi:hypothetical protein
MRAEDERDLPERFRDLFNLIKIIRAGFRKICIAASKSRYTDRASRAGWPAGQDKQWLSIAMAHPAIRVTFADDAVAYEQWDAFGNSIADRVSSLARKRDGASYVLLLRDVPESRAQQVAAWCGSQPGVVTVAAIAESEFWAAPSNAV